VAGKGSSWSSWYIITRINTCHWST
jgi:hypothetical protein